METSLRAWLSAFLLCLMSLVHADGQNRVAEVQALMSFKEAALDGSSLADTIGDIGYWFTWKEAHENACEWGGVTCTSNSTVAALDLSNWGMSNPTSLEALSRLPDLRQLDLSNNYMGGPIPEDINSLTELNVLKLSGNNLTGGIPQNISECRSLHYISLDDNTLSGPVPDLSALVNLRFLYLGNNNLSGGFPQELATGMSSLVDIDLSDNQFYGQIPSLMSLTELAGLYLRHNNFDSFEEPLQLNTLNLLALDLSGNQLEGALPQILTSLPNLTSIKMSGNRLSGNIPPGLSKPQYLWLDLSQNQLSGPIPVDLLQPLENTSVFYVNVSRNLLNSSIPTPTVTGRPDGLGLAVLDLSQNQLTGTIPSQLMTVFFELDLQHNLLSGDIVDVLADSQAFQTVSVMTLDDNLLSGDLSRMTFNWANWSVLLGINLSNNSLSWTRTDSLPDPVSAALNNFPDSLLEFWVGGNGFLGTSLPTTPLSRALNLSLLDLSDNQLTGEISDAVFNSTWMPNLQILKLGNNHATGSIPASIVMPNLQVLELMNNDFSGHLPPMPLNSTLINPSFYEGNEGLCGYPLPKYFCPQIKHTGMPLWQVLLIVGGSVIIAAGGSGLVATWRWRVYRRRHKQDADLIRTLMERDSVTIMHLRSLTKATENFAESGLIGEGGFGTVYSGKLQDGTKVAIKRSKREGSNRDKEQFLNEVRILSQVNHRHLVKLMGCCMENKVALLVFEFVPNGTLQEHLQGKIGDARLSWIQRLNIAVQTADALNYLHSAATFPIYHRDVKSANILLNDDLSAKVADFGISKLAPAEATHVSTAVQGTMGYIDPEYWTSFQLTDKSDVYSFGVVLLELVSGKPAIDFQRSGEESSLVFFAVSRIKSGDVEPLIDPALMGTLCDPAGRASILSVGRLSLKCLEMRSMARPSMNEVWKELQNLRVRFTGGTSTREDERFMDEDYNDDPQRDDEVLISTGVPSDAKSIQMSQFSAVTV